MVSIDVDGQICHFCSQWFVPWQILVVLNMGNPLENPATNTMGASAYCWSCKQKWAWEKNKQPTAFSVLIQLTNSSRAIQWGAIFSAVFGWKLILISSPEAYEHRECCGLLDFLSCSRLFTTSTKHHGSHWCQTTQHKIFWPSGALVYVCVARIKTLNKKRVFSSQVNMIRPDEWVAAHTSYLSFFWHRHHFLLKNLTPKRVNRNTTDFATKAQIELSID